MIPVRNIFHMLAYAFSTLRQEGFRDLGTEEFDNVQDLFAEILSRGIDHQLKRGLGRQYLPRQEKLSTVRGRIDINESLRTGAWFRHQVVCDYDELTPDTTMNRVLKSAMLALLRCDLDGSRRQELRRVLPYFGEVRTVDLRSVDWHFRFDRGNAGYRLLLYICWLVREGLLLDSSGGTARMQNFLNEQAESKLFERFLVEYFRREHPELSVSSPHIPWAVDGPLLGMLPTMKTDLVLQKGMKMLIIDAKYYQHSTQQYFDSPRIHSGHLYQMFTYVKNMAARVRDVPMEVAGMVLYARTDEDVQPGLDGDFAGNGISVGALDLDADFTRIREQLDAIVATHFPEPALV